MPYRNGSRPGWRSKKSFGTLNGVDVGSFNISLGTDDEAEANKCEEMMTQLTKLGKKGAQILQQIGIGKRRAIDVLHSFNVGDLGSLEVVLSDESLATAWTRFVDVAKRKDGTALTERTKHDYKAYLKCLMAIDPTATVADLPKLLDDYRTEAIAKGHNDQFRKVRAACLSFARNTETDKQYSELWKEIAKIGTVAAGTGKLDVALRVYEVREIIEALPNKRYQNIAWMMCFTGMGPKDYAGEWHIKSDRIVIHGTKNVNRVREVPKLSDTKPESFRYYYPGQGYIQNEVKSDLSPVDYNYFNKAVKKASHKKISANAFRHCYRLWLREAGIDDWRADRYFGHVVKEVKRKYAASEWSTFLNDDTEKLIEYIKREWEKPKTTKKEIKRLSI